MVDPNTGKKKKTTYRGFKSEREAERASRYLEHKLDKGILAHENNIFEDVYLEWRDRHNRLLKPSTRYKTDTIFSKQILPHFRKLRISDIDSDYCQQIVDIWRETLSASTTKDYKGHASRVFKYAMQKEYIFRNPMQFAIVTPDEEEFIDDDEDEFENFWDRDQFNYFCSYAIDEMDFQDFVMFHTLGTTGLRKGEMLALKWSDIDFEEKYIRIRRTLFFLNKKNINQKAKTKASRRDVPLTEEAWAVLNKWRTIQKEKYLAEGIKNKLNLVLTRGDFQPVRLATPNERLHKFLKSHEELPQITVHGFRHTYASNLSAAGVTIEEAQKFLGHKRMETTANIYTHVSKKKKSAAFKKYENYMKKAENL
jgi:integrase